MKKILPILACIAFLTSSCADECDDFAEVFCAKFSVCGGYYYDSEEMDDCIERGLERIDQWKIAEGESDEESQNHCSDSLKNLEAKSCEEFNALSTDSD